MAQTGAVPITIWQLLGSTAALPQQKRLPEGASKTFKVGVPVVLTTGAIAESGVITGAATIVGFSSEPAHNLTTLGTAPIGGSGTTFGSVPNQSSAVNVPIGAPMADGNCGVYIASNETIFQGKTASNYTITGATRGAIFGLTKDSGTAQWFVDTDITAANSGAILEVVDLVDPVGTVGGQVAFRVTNVSQAFNL